MLTTIGRARMFSYRSSVYIRFGIPRGVRTMMMIPLACSTCFHKRSLGIDDEFIFVRSCRNVLSRKENGGKMDVGR